MDQTRYKLESADGVNKFGGVLTILYQKDISNKQLRSKPEIGTDF